MASLLRSKKKWFGEDIVSEFACASSDMVLNEEDVNSVPEHFSFQQLIKHELGPCITNTAHTQEEVAESSSSTHDDTNQALANLLLDTSMSSEASVHKSSHLRALQPQREKPSKDRGKRFAAGDLRGNESTQAGVTDDINEFDYWILFPSASCYKRAKVFMLGQVMLVLKEGKAVRSGMRCIDTEVVLKMYCYHTESDRYSPEGFSSVTKSTTLQHNITTSVHQDEGGIRLVLEDPTLSDYKPFHTDIDIPLEQQPSEVGSDFEEADEYVVEDITRRRYNTKEGHFEYCVKWKGYSCAYNTWELDTNIPASDLQDYEQRIAYGSTTMPSREGLHDRTKRKTTYDSDYVF